MIQRYCTTKGAITKCRELGGLEENAAGNILKSLVDEEAERLCDAKRHEQTNSRRQVL